MIEETVVNGQIDIIRANYRIFRQMLKPSRKNSLELQKVENCTIGACTELIGATQ